MTYTISVSEETYRLLEKYRKVLEEVFKRKMSYDEVLHLVLSNNVHFAIYFELSKRLSSIERGLEEVTVPQFPRKYEVRHNKFVGFIKDVVVYPLDKIRTSKEKIERYINEGIFKIIHAAGRSYLVYKPKLLELWNKLPIPKDKVKELSKEEQKLLEVLKNAGLVYEDGVTKSIRKAVSEL